MYIYQTTSRKFTCESCENVPEGAKKCNLIMTDEENKMKNFEKLNVVTKSGNDQ